MNSSLYTGVLGLKNHQLRMDVIGNNIANINTYGFKKGRATFADLLSRTYFAASAPRGGRGGINPLQVGLGVTTAAVTNIMNQGQLEMTGRLTDVAADGNGWFVLQDGSGETVYTRDGAFGLDKEGSLVNANGWYVQGWSRIEVDNNHNFEVDTQRPVENIDFQYGEKLGAEATNKVGMKSNLNSDARSIVADDIDPKEGFANSNDLLVDLYDSDGTDPSHLGIREGDWLEVHVDVEYQDIVNLGQSVTLSAGTDVYGDGSLYSFTGQVDISLLPMANIVDPGVWTRVYDSPNQIRGNVNTYSIDPNSGIVYAGSDMSGQIINFDVQSSALNTLPYDADKYLYFQVTNDTDIGDLENVIQNALDAIDLNGTLNSTVTFDSDDGKFYIYNNAVSGARDYNNIHVEINAVSGSAVRRGYLLRESTYPTLTGTRLVLVGDGREHVTNFDYQTTQSELDYGDITGSPQLFGEVIRARLERTYDAAMVAQGFLNLTNWSGYTDGGNLQMVKGTAELSVNGTIWREVEAFTGAANEYRISTAANVPRVYFNAADAVDPALNSTIVFNYRTQNHVPVALTSTTDYNLDNTSGQVSMLWSNSTANATLGAVGFTGTVRMTADYTTETRSYTPPSQYMNSRWADFIQEWKEVNEGGSGKARTEFNNMFSVINAARDALTPGTIADQGTSLQPTQKSTSLFQSGKAYRTSIDVFNSLGENHTLQFIFTHVGSNYDLTEQIVYQNRWYWRAELPYEDVFAFDSMDYIDDTFATARLEGELQFDNNGLVIQRELGGNTGPVMFDPSPIGAAGNSTHSVDDVFIDIDFDGHGSPIDGATQFASDFTIHFYEQNGWGMGILETFAIDQSGIIEGRYSNNVVKPIAQIALAMFANQEGLHKENNNVFALSANSGLPSIVPAYVGGAGAIIGGSLEMSNVDIVEEFTNMIITERGFQANSRIITTSDEMLTEVINLKR